MTFWQFLLEKGYTPDEANVACICVENELPMSKELNELYAYWWDKMFKETFGKEKNETNYNKN